jgi:hypothetical protein
MRTLPDNPNPDHLRRESKDLLAGLRDSRPEASLAEAQALLADQYGFRTWTELKAEADRRRGRADLADEGLARAVAARFGLGAIAAPRPVLCHNTLGPACARLGVGGRLLVAGWEHAGGQPPSWELGSALMQWTLGPGGGANLAGARAMIEGYRAQAGSLPPLGLPMFRGAVIGLLNHLGDQVEEALATGDAGRRRQAERSLGHLLTHLPSRAGLERLLEAALAPAG